MNTTELQMLHTAWERDFHHVDLCSARLSYIDLQGAQLTKRQSKICKICKFALGGFASNESLIKQWNFHKKLISNS